MPGPNTACILVVAGILGIYVECTWPGRILPGVAGAAVLIAGAYSLYGLSPTAPGLALIAVSVLLFAAEAIWDFRLVYGIAATTAFAAGMRLLLDPPGRVALPLAIAAAAILGTATVSLASAAKRARRNKRSDIGWDKRA